MTTWQSRTAHALKIWQALPPEQQAELRARLMGTRAIQLDTTRKEAPKVVSIIFGMDVSAHSRYVYLLNDDIREK